MKLNPSLFLAGAIVLGALGMQTAEAGTLENLERERAHLVELFHDDSLTPDERQIKIEAAGRRLRDLERMVMRDTSLRGKSTPIVRNAFEDYELSFLLHSAAENGVTITEQWFTKVGLSTETLLSTRVGRR